MEDETERELSTERKINSIILYLHYRKPLIAKVYDFIELLDQTKKEKLPIVSGSCMEGAQMARNLNPNMNKKYYEREFDIMFPVTKILRNRSREVIVDLGYAKGFAWIKYKPGCFDSPHKINGLLIKHKDGNTYVNSKAIRETFTNSLNFDPDSNGFVQEAVEGPSANVIGRIGPKKFPSEDTVLEAIKTLQECARIIENTSKPLGKFYADVLLELQKLEKIIQGNSASINITDMKELASVVLPINKERQNFILKVHWMSLAFINETLSTILTIDKILRKKDLLERLGLVKAFYLVHLTPLQLSKGKKIFESLNSYFKYLVYLMPKEVYQIYKTNPEDGLFHFLQKSLYSKQDEIKKLFRVLSNWKRNLLQKCSLLDSLKEKIKPFTFLDYKTIGLGLSVDRVPAIVVADFPNIASEWVTRHREWPSLSVVKRISMSGCHIVPKPYCSEEENNFLDWRWSFSLAEIILANSRTTRMNISYLLLKSIFYRYLKPIEYDKKTLASYIIKTVMLWQCEENDETWWSNKSIVKCVSVLLNRLKLSFFKRYLPHYFIREINLFHDVSDELVLYGQAVLESLCADPIVCIEDVLEFYIPEYPFANNKNNVETRLKPKLNFLSLAAQLPEAVEIDEEKCKDYFMQRITGGGMNLFKTFFEGLMPNLVPGIPADSLSEKNTSRDKEINFDDLMETIHLEFSDVFDIPLD